MATTPNDFDVFEVEVISVKGECDAGHHPGEGLRLSCWDSGGLCGFFYNSIFPNLSVMQFGGKYPWSDADEMKLGCPDPHNLVTVVVKRKKD